MRVESLRDRQGRFIGTEKPDRAGWWTVDGQPVLVVWCRDIGGDEPGHMAQILVNEVFDEDDPLCSEWSMKSVWPSHLPGEWRWLCESED